MAKHADPERDNWSQENYLQYEKQQNNKIRYLVGISYPDPNGSALVWLSWIRVRVSNRDPDH